MCVLHAEDASQSFDLRALALLSPVFAPAIQDDRSTSQWPRVVDLLPADEWREADPRPATRLR
jgi:hypothetical protein